MGGYKLHGLQRRLHGELSAVKGNDAPIFVNSGRCYEDERQYLYRSSDGKWRVTDKLANIAKNHGALESSRASDLPSEAGLGWKWFVGKGVWRDDPDLRCKEVYHGRTPYQAEPQRGAHPKKNGRVKAAAADQEPG